MITPDDTSAISAATSSADWNEPVCCTTKPVTIGASAPPTNPPKSMMAPSDAAYCVGAQAVASDQDVPLAKKPKNIVTEIAATAMVLLGVSAATSVASAITPRAEPVHQRADGEDQGKRGTLRRLQAHGLRLDGMVSSRDCSYANVSSLIGESA